MDAKATVKASEVISKSEWYSEGIYNLVKVMVDKLEQPLPVTKNVLDIPGVSKAKKRTYKLGSSEIKFENDLAEQQVRWVFNVDHQGNVFLSSTWKDLTSMSNNFPDPYPKIGIGRITEKIITSNEVDIAFQYQLHMEMPSYGDGYLLLSEAISDAEDLLQKLKNMQD